MFMILDKQTQIERINNMKLSNKEYESKFNDYREKDEEQKEQFINEKLNKLPIHHLLKHIVLNDQLMGFDATSLYPSAVWVENSIYSRIETRGYAFTKGLNDELVEKFNKSNFSSSAISKIKYYNPKDLFVQHLPVKEKINKVETNCMRNGYIIDNLTRVDILEIVKFGGKLIEIYEGVIYQENFRVSPFKEVIDKLFAFRKKYKDENKDVMPMLVKLIRNSLYGERISRDMYEKFSCKSE